MRIPCEHCCGSGMRELTDTERDTRNATGPSWSTTSDVGRRLSSIQGHKTSPTALINRLNALTLRGLVERKQLDGKRLLWRASLERDIRGEAIEAEKWGRTMRGQR